MPKTNLQDRVNGLPHPPPLELRVNERLGWLWCQLCQEYVRVERLRSHAHEHTEAEAECVCSHHELGILTVDALARNQAATLRPQ